MPKRVFGDIPGYEEGTYFASRLDVSRAGIHRPTQAGISGTASEGADSIVVSGGYEDDSDMGSEILYIGHGGRDPETGEQVADQELTSGNLALMFSCEQGLPVRVVRGANIHSHFAPKQGYRYDGTYTVAAYWQQKGKSGHLVWCFRLQKIRTDSTPWKAAPPAYLSANSGRNSLSSKSTKEKKLNTTPSQSAANRFPSSAVRKSVVADVPNIPGYSVGSKVKHPVFGVGVVFGMQPIGTDQIVTVEFEDGGPKRLVASRANLETLE